MNKLAQKEIKNITDAIIKNYQPEKIILFGSGVRGEYGRNSDLDFFIVKNTKKKWVDRIAEVYGYIRSRTLPVDVIVYTAKQMENRLAIADPFIEEIISNGKVLYEKK